MDDGSHVAIVAVNGSFLREKKNKVIIQIQYMYYQLVIYTLFVAYTTLYQKNHLR
jgi:hypothetical protein